MRFKILFLACISSIIISCADNPSVNNALPISGENIPLSKENSEPTNLFYSGEYEIDGVLFSARTVDKLIQDAPSIDDILTSAHLEVRNTSNKEITIELNETFLSDSKTKNKNILPSNIEEYLQNNATNQKSTKYEKIAAPLIKLAGHFSGAAINVFSMGLANSLATDAKKSVENFLSAVFGINTEEDKKQYASEQASQLKLKYRALNNTLTIKAGGLDSILLFFGKVNIAKALLLTTTIPNQNRIIEIELSPEGAFKQNSTAVERIEPTLSTGEKQIIQTNTSGEEKTPIPSVSSVLVQKTTNIPTPPNFSTDKNPTPVPEDSIPNGKPTISPVLVPDGKSTIFPTPPDLSTGEKQNTLPSPPPNTPTSGEHLPPPSLLPDISTGEKQNTQPPPQLDIPTGEKENSLPSLSPAQ